MKKTKIIAIGGGGIAIAYRLFRKSKMPWIEHAAFVFADTDESNLALFKSKEEYIELVHLSHDVPLLPTHPLYYEGEIFPNDIVHSDALFPEEVLKDTDKLLFIACAGGKTGSRYAIELTKAAKKLNIPKIVGFLTRPFNIEGRERCFIQSEVFSILRVRMDIVTYSYNYEALIDEYDDLITWDNAFKIADMHCPKYIEENINLEK